MASRGTYASQTSVSPERSKAEIERTLQRYGATAFGYGWDDERMAAMIAFKSKGRQVRFLLPLPEVKDFRYTEKNRQWRNDSAMHKAHEQGVRQRWRALALSIKAKLEAVEAGIVTFEAEFLAHFVLPDGMTVEEKLGPELETIGTKQLPSILPGLPAGEVLDGEVVG